MEEKKCSTGSTIAKILTVIGLVTVVATVVTIVCKKIAAKKQAALAEETAIDDYDECCFDCDSDDCENCAVCDTCDDDERDADATVAQDAE